MKFNRDRYGRIHEAITPETEPWNTIDVRQNYNPTAGASASRLREHGVYFAVEAESYELGVVHKGVYMGLSTADALALSRALLAVATEVEARAALKELEGE